MEKASAREGMDVADVCSFFRKEDKQMVFTDLTLLHGHSARSCQWPVQGGMGRAPGGTAVLGRVEEGVRAASATDTPH